MIGVRVGSCLLIWGCLASACFATADDNVQTSGFRRSAFDGKTLDGWRVVGCQAAVENGHLVILDGDGLVISEHRYQDFIFEWECRPRRGANWDSGVFFRFEMPPPGRPWPQRYQVNLRQEQEGHLIGVPQATGASLFQAGKWNRFKLQVVGTKASLHTNGERAWETDTIQTLEGHLGIQVEVPGGGQFEFRNLCITEIGYRPLFNGVDLSGWEGASGEAFPCWTVEDGLLVCTGKPGPWLRSKEQVGDFNLRLEYRVKEGGNSGIYVRVPLSGNHHGEGAGVEIQILDDAAERYADLKPYQFSASVYAIAPAQPRVTRPVGSWNSLEIECRSASYRVVQNGIPVVKADETDFPPLKHRLTRGYLGLQNHREHVWFRNLRMRALTP